MMFRKTTKYMRFLFQSNAIFAKTMQFRLLRWTFRYSCFPNSQKLLQLSIIWRIFHLLKINIPEISFTLH